MKDVQEIMQKWQYARLTRVSYDIDILNPAYNYLWLEPANAMDPEWLTQHFAWCSIESEAHALRISVARDKVRSLGEIYQAILDYLGLAGWEAYSEKASMTSFKRPLG